MSAPLSVATVGGGIVGLTELALKDAKVVLESHRGHDLRADPVVVQGKQRICEYQDLVAEQHLDAHGKIEHVVALDVHEVRATGEHRVFIDKQLVERVFEGRAVLRDCRKPPAVADAPLTRELAASDEVSDDASCRRASSGWCQT